MKTMNGIKRSAAGLVAAVVLPCAAAIETSPIMEKVTDPVSGVVSYALKYGAPDDNRQSIYFTAKSITDDGRYLVFWYTKGNEKKGIDGVRWTMLADLDTGKVTRLAPRDDMVIPFVETKRNYLVYGSPQADGFWRIDFADPEHPKKLCGQPKELEQFGRPRRYYTHLTLTKDRKKAFLDASIESDKGLRTPANKGYKERFVQGLIDFETGKFDVWGESPFLCNHGQINPADDSLAMGAWEFCWRGDGKKFQKEHGVYPRMWFFEKGKRTLVKPRINHASHEMWDDDGKGHYWCGKGIWHRDLATGKIECWSDKIAAHANASPDCRYFVYDHATNGQSWRGCGWIVTFLNRDTGRRVDIYSARPPLNPKNKPSVLHPDPHPHFVMNGKYVVSTACNADGHMDLYITPVDQLVKMTAAEETLAAMLPSLFERSAAHYRALDAAAVAAGADGADGKAPRIPYSFDAKKREQVFSTVTGWTSGFYPGTLWLIHEATGDAFFKDRATFWTETLEPNKTYNGNHDTGFKIMCSYGNARRILGTDRYDAIILKSAETLSTRFYEPLGLIRSWGKIDNMKEFLVIPDNMMNLELLEWAAKHGGRGTGNGDRFDKIARSHADVTMARHFRPDSSVYHVISYDPKSGRIREIKRGQGASCDTTWSRGQAWAIYGYSMMYRETGDGKYLAQARKAADYAMGHPNMPEDGIPFWDYGAPGEERDSSAGAVMASALLELSTSVPGADGERYRAFAVKQLLSLASNAYYSEGGEIGHWLLKHATAHKLDGHEVDAPLCYGDYYFLEALLRFRKLKAGNAPAADGRDAASGKAALKAAFSDLPAAAAPEAVFRRVTDQFLSTRPENYLPQGYRGNNGYGWNRIVQYSVVSLWFNAMECARLAGDAEREERLVRLYDDFLPGGAKHSVCSPPRHVDDAIFGAVPLEVFVMRGDRCCLEQGLKYADTQWCEPCEATYKERQSAKPEVQREYYKKGLSVQTRLWIDDMYMIAALQSQAYRATGERKYIDRAAKEMVFYLDALQLKDGAAKGLFHHAPDAPFVWSRGDGWMAAAMALVLDCLPQDSAERPRIMRGYMEMMEALLKFQRDDGLWCQLIDRPDDPRNWGETSCTAMFAYAFATGIANGWLDAAQYGPAARNAYLALCARMDRYGNISDVCIGTNKGTSEPYYYARRRINGDPHAQAPMLWTVRTLLSAGLPR